MAMDIRLDTVTKTGKVYTAYVQLVDSKSGKILETFSCTYDPDKKGGFAAALKAKAEAVRARIEEKDAARGEIEAIIAQIRAETGG